MILRGHCFAAVPPLVDQPIILLARMKSPKIGSGSTFEQNHASIMPSHCEVVEAPRCTQTAPPMPIISLLRSGSLSSAFRPKFKGFQSSALRAFSSQPDSMERITGSNEEAQYRMRDLVNNKSMDEWDKCWEERVTPWDLGRVTPIVSHLVQQQGLLPQGRVLVPGCGAGYDVVALASPNRYVIGVEISEKAVKQAQELASSAPNAKYCEFVKADFFTWSPVETFDLIFDYTFFCAIEPSMRSAWGERVAELLKHDGELITLMFPIDDHEGGPPYAVSIPRYEEVLHPLGFEAISIEKNEMAVGRRKGREMLGRWKRKVRNRL